MNTKIRNTSKIIETEVALKQYGPTATGRLPLKFYNLFTVPGVDKINAPPPR